MECSFQYALQVQHVHRVAKVVEVPLLLSTESALPSLPSRTLSAPVLARALSWMIADPLATTHAQSDYPANTDDPQQAASTSSPAITGNGRSCQVMAQADCVEGSSNPAAMYLLMVDPSTLPIPCDDAHAPQNTKAAASKPSELELAGLLATSARASQSSTATVGGAQTYLIAPQCFMGAPAERSREGPAEDTFVEMDRTGARRWSGLHSVLSMAFSTISKRGEEDADVINNTSDESLLLPAERTTNLYAYLRLQFPCQRFFLFCSLLSGNKCHISLLLCVESSVHLPLCEGSFLPAASGFHGKYQ
jgi:hypothetical protein